MQLIKSEPHKLKIACSWMKAVSLITSVAIITPRHLTVLENAEVPRRTTFIFSEARAVQSGLLYLRHRWEKKALEVWPAPVQFVMTSLMTKSLYRIFNANRCPKPVKLALIYEHVPKSLYFFTDSCRHVQSFNIENDFPLFLSLYMIYGIGLMCLILVFNLSQPMRLWYLSHRRPAKAQASLRTRAVSPELSLFTHMNYGSKRRVRLKLRHLAPLDGCACVFEEWIYGGQKVPKSHELAHFEYVVPNSIITLTYLYHDIYAYLSTFFN